MNIMNTDIELTEEFKDVYVLMEKTNQSMFITGIDSEKFEITEHKNETVSVEFSYKYANTNHLRTDYKPFKKLIPHVGIFDDTFDDTFE